MNRHERRKAKAKVRSVKIELDRLHSTFDVMFESKGQVVMICANLVGQKAVEDLWPDVRWPRDEKFANKPPDWQFTHIRVTKLPPHLEAAVPLAFANGDSLAFAAALALCRHAPRLSTRIAWWTGDINTPADYELHTFGGPASDESHGDLFAEYVPYGSPVYSEPPSVN
jgi:hypothetical protein